MRRTRGYLGGQVPMPVLLGLLAVSLVAAVLLFVWGSRLQQEVTLKQQSVDQLTAANEELQQRLQGIEQERRQLESRLRDLKTQLASAHDEMSKLRDAQVRYDALKDEKSRLEAQLSQLKHEREDSQDRLAGLEEENEDLERTAGRLRNRLTLLDRDYQQLAEKVAHLEREQASTPIMLPEAGAPVSLPPPSPAPSSSAPGMDSSTPSVVTPSQEAQTVELPPIFVGKEEALTGAFPVRGRLVELNDAHQFVVIDQGADAGVQMGMTFDVLRGNRTIGQAVVVRVRPRIAACDLVAASGDAPRVGDLVIQRGP